MKLSILRRGVCGAMFAALPVLAANAQAHAPESSFTTAQRSWGLSRLYRGQDVPPPNFQNSPRVDKLVRDGKIMLSLDDAIALALENNLDLAIARYNLDIAETDILRTKSGAAVRGVASGLVQGTPGGGIGGFGSGAPGVGAGGTSGGAGGAGSGAGGLVQSTIGTGAPIDSLDPAVTSSIFLQHVASPLANIATTGTPLYRQNTAQANFAYTQAFGTGTSVNFSFDNNRQTNNSPYTTLTPALNSTFQFNLTQHLLAGFGTASNRRYIYIARNNREISDVAFRNQVIATVTQVQNIYWDLVNAFEDVKVKERSQTLAQKTLDDDRKQEELQSMAAMDVLKAESEVDTRNQELTVAQATLELQQLLMKNAITRNLNDTTLAGAPVVPTDSMTVSETEEVIPTQDLVAEAQAHRPELAQARMDLLNREITRKAARNALLPALDLAAYYGGAGLGGTQNPYLSSTTSGLLSPTGFGDALQNSFNGSSPNYQVGFNLTIPLRNRAARADQLRSELEYRQAELRLGQLRNEIGIEVRNAQFALQQNRARVGSASKARDLAQRTFEIEEKKFALGSSTSLQVLEASRDLALAESNLVTAMTSYEKSRVELDRAVGATLLRNSISIADAESGVVNSVPQVPGLAPRSESGSSSSDQRLQ